MSEILRFWTMAAGHQVRLLNDGEFRCSCGCECQHRRNMEQAFENGELDVNTGTGQSDVPKINRQPQVDNSWPLLKSVIHHNPPKKIFEDGKPWEQGMKRKSIIKTFQFRSSKNPSTLYSTLKYEDGTFSCNCPGWTRHVNADGSRSCKHTAIAASQRENGTWEVTQKNPQTPASIKKLEPLKHGEAAPVSMKPSRKFKFDED